MTKRFLHLWLLLSVTLLISACHIDDDESVEPSPNPTSVSGGADFKPFYAPLGGLVPFPNDLFIDPTTGFVALPVVDETDFGDPKVAMNQLNGFSTIAPSTTRFSGSIDATTLVGNQTVFVVNITNPAAPVVLLEGVDYTLRVSSADDAVLEIKPVTALNPSSRYAVIITTGVSSSGGDAATKDNALQQIIDAIEAGETLDDIELETVRSLVVEPLLAVSTGLGISNDDIAVIWSYTTQPIGTALAAVAAAATPQASAIGFAGITTAAVNPALVGIADVYAGTVDVPYFHDSANPLTGFWETSSGDPAGAAAPVAQETLSIPVLLTVPNGAVACPGAPWPTAIFQHGITRDRTDMFAVAEAFAAACFATIAIDMPLHGITDTTNLFIQPGNERHFDLDADGDGVVDDSGANFINLASLLTSRDNLRQASADIISLITTIPTIDFDGDTVADLDGSTIFFSGLSLGAMTGVNALASDSTPFAATLAAPGGAIGDLLVDSATFSQPIADGLAAVGVVQGTQLFNDFIRDAQTVVDDGDPLNYIAATTAALPTHLIEVVPDLVIPNSSTEKLIALGGFTVLTAANAGANAIGAGAGAAVRFIEGEHGSILDPTASLAATTEMQTQMATLAGSLGTVLLISDPTVIEP